MMSIDYVIYLSMMIMSCMILSSGFFHVLKVLMALEFIIISVIVIMAYYLNFSESSVLMIYYMVFAVCEAIIGLTLMILMVRYKGNEYTKSMILGKW